MCFILHIGATRSAPRVAWNEKDRHLCVEDIHGDASLVRFHFTLPEVAYIGSDLGCGCGFRFVTFQNGGWPEEWMIEQNECERPENDIQTHQELYDLVAALLENTEFVELYGCWDGNEADKPEHIEEIRVGRLVDTSFWFRERGFYRIVKSEQGS